MNLFAEPNVNFSVDPGIPTPPVLTLDAYDATTADVSFTKSPGASKFYLTRRPGAGTGSGVLIHTFNPTDTLTFHDTGLNPAIEYFYYALASSTGVLNFGDVDLSNNISPFGCFSGI